MTTDVTKAKWYVISECGDIFERVRTSGVIVKAMRSLAAVFSLMQESSK